ncbi:hypothetical protein [Actinophytocola xinjiangensis]|jgi:hypothetical protein|uniref:hypothetical protein n=1 Tax=Actinophytocola xinjiangensis TaxID=485602 RepID=UPI000AA8C05F|nr:hypothetical protein [Actinophytocola xinjiangensis]
MSAATATTAAFRTDVTPVLVIEEFDHWHNQPDAMLSPTSITWNDPVTTTRRAA